MEINLNHLALLPLFILPCFLSAEGIALGALLHLSGDFAMEGAAFREGLYHSAVADSDNAESTRLKEEYVKKYSKTPGLIMFNAWGYDSILMYKEAILTGARTREEIKDALYKIKNLQGATGEIAVNPKGSAPKYISMFQVKNSKLELIEGPDPDVNK